MLFFNNILMEKKINKYRMRLVEKKVQNINIKNKI